MAQRKLSVSGAWWSNKREREAKGIELPEHYPAVVVEDISTEISVRGRSGAYEWFEVEFEDPRLGLYEMRGDAVELYEVVEEEKRKM